MARHTQNNSGGAEVLPSLVALIPGVGLFGAGLFTFKPNRVAQGELVTLLELATGGGGAIPAPAVVLAAAAGVILSLTGRPGSLRARYRLIALGVWAVTMTVIPWYALSQGASMLVRQGDLAGIARISPASGFWLALVAGLAAWHEVFRSASQRRVVIALIGFSIAAVVLILVMTPVGPFLAYTQEYLVRSERFRREAQRHIQLAGTAVAFACGIGVPAGMVAYRYPRARDAILGVTSTIQTVPSLAMFGLLIAPLAAFSRAFPVLRSLGIAGVGATPALIALTLYALLPVVRNTLTGLMMVPAEVRESGRAMGMQRRQQFWMVEVPLAFPLVLRGVHTASVQAVGNTTVAALIGAGGFGWFIFQGLGQAATDLVVLGVIPIVGLAIAVDRFFFLVQRLTDWGQRV